ncbi:ComF family protein [Desulfonema ishimotonii]|uniref:ComF family protein n=1 Tax=Desulfonema ishimotonii TaxID=45657 RepID=A0A401G3Z4_9BACT|nr:ComF family protein [Desulfonema ishimotonii]GBC63835.1 ComF family protein [Desulfonema ishimotonii]
MWRYRKHSDAGPRISSLATDLLHGLFNLIFPPKCAACGTLFHLPPDRDIYTEKIQTLSGGEILSPVLCPDCRKDVTSPEKPVYGSQLMPPRRFRIAWSCGLYQREGALGKIIRRYKYNRRLYLADPLGRLLFGAFLRRWRTRGMNCITPVPLHIRKMKERGFNQVWLMIRDWPRLAEQFGTDLGGGVICRELLLRTRKTRPQAGLDRKRRASNISGAFQLHAGADVRGKKILLVDDVITTGATADECTRVLLAAGAEYVGVLTLARAGKTDDDGV